MAATIEALSIGNFQRRCVVERYGAALYAPYASDTSAGSIAPSPEQ